MTKSRVETFYAKKKIFKSLIVLLLLTINTRAISKYLHEVVKELTKTTPMGFEPTRAEHIGLAVQRLNLSATASLTAGRAIPGFYKVGTFYVEHNRKLSRLCFLQSSFCEPSRHRTKFNKNLNFEEPICTCENNTFLELIP